MPKAEIGHNSPDLNEKIQALASRYAKCDEESQELNQERADIRAEIDGLGLDTKAWQDQINRAKQSLKKRDGYDESASIIAAALGTMQMEDLFAHVVRKEKEKQQARDAKREDGVIRRAEEKAKREPADPVMPPAKGGKGKNVDKAEFKKPGIKVVN